MVHFSAPGSVCLSSSSVWRHDLPRDPSGDFLAQSWCALSFGEFRSGEIVPRDGMSCGEFENGVRPGRRRSARCYGQNENAKKVHIHSKRKEGSRSEVCWMFHKLLTRKTNPRLLYNSWTIIHFIRPSFVLCSHNARSIKQPLFPTFHTNLNCPFTLAKNPMKRRNIAC